MREATLADSKRKERSCPSVGGCPCGAVRFEIDVPAVLAWHDHSEAGRRAHGETLAPLKGYRGVMWTRPKRMRRQALHDPDFDV